MWGFSQRTIVKNVRFFTSHKKLVNLLILAKFFPENSFNNRFCKYHCDYNIRKIEFKNLSDNFCPFEILL